MGVFLNTKLLIFLNHVSMAIYPPHPHNLRFMIYLILFVTFNSFIIKILIVAL